VKTNLADLPRGRKVSEGKRGGGRGAGEEERTYCIRSAWTRRVMMIVKKKTTTRPPQIRQSQGEREMREETIAAERRQIPYRGEASQYAGRE
jgi:hypothetical protein